MESSFAASQQPSPPRRRFPWPLALVLAGGIGTFMLLLIFFGYLMGASQSDGGASFGGGPRIAVIRISGPIVSGSGGSSIVGGVGAGGEDIVRQLREARDDDRVKAVILRLNSPGGSAAASQEVYQEVLRVRKSGRYVLASMSDVAASGAYYIASGCDEIMADPATMTGSIGVIMELTNFAGLMQKLGIADDTVKSGPHKDMGSPMRALTPAERKLLQGMIDDVYQQFVHDVATGRKMSVAKVKQLADGRVFTGRQALRVGLVDCLGSFHDAVQRAAKRVGIPGEPKLISYERHSVIESLLGTTAQRLGEGIGGAVMESARPRMPTNLLQLPWH